MLVQEAVCELSRHLGGGGGAQPLLAGLGPGRAACLIRRAGCGRTQCQGRGQPAPGAVGVQRFGALGQVQRGGSGFVREACIHRRCQPGQVQQGAQLGAVQADLLEMEAQVRAAWLLTIRATALLDAHESNKLESSMAKAKAGKVVTWVTQKAVELLGPKGYSTELLVEKWMRDAKINDIFEGTGQINTLIVAREILGYTRLELK